MQGETVIRRNMLRAKARAVLDLFEQYRRHMKRRGVDVPAVRLTPDRYSAVLVDVREFMRKQALAKGQKEPERLASLDGFTIGGLPVERCDQ
ncbi:MAG: hypothetical protein ACU85V_00180 [Gammaproteobacteria bacterium]